MKLLKTALFVNIVLGFFLSCSSINRESREQYNKTNPFKHGIIVTTSNPKEVKLLFARSFDSNEIKKGRKLYEMNCLGCHGTSGHGDGPRSAKLKNKPSDITKIARTNPNFKFYMMVSKWKGEMPGWKNDLTKDEISSIEAYITHLGRSSKAK